MLIAEENASKKEHIQKIAPVGQTDGEGYEFLLKAE
jgi:hypothetical protein